jgi:hypothetical protein
MKTVLLVTCFGVLGTLMSASGCAEKGHRLTFEPTTDAPSWVDEPNRAQAAQDRATRQRRDIRRSY